MPLYQIYMNCVLNEKLKKEISLIDGIVTVDAIFAKYDGLEEKLNCVKDKINSIIKRDNRGYKGCRATSL